MYSKTKYRRAQPEDLDEKDSVLAGVEFNVVYLGSAVVPTYNGHGSSDTEVVVDRLYAEKYKPFSFSAKIRVTVHISSEKISVIELVERVMKEVAYFPLDIVTFCDTDRKHDRAFAFVVRENAYPSFKAYVFHCESNTKAKEMVKICNEAMLVKSSLQESSRLRSLSAPHHRTRSVQHATTQRGVLTKPEQHRDLSSDKHKMTNRLCTNQTQDKTRLRSWTEVPKTNTHPISVRTANGTNLDRRLASNANKLIDFGMEDENEDDEFTQLAKKRTASFNLPVEETTFFIEKAVTKAGSGTQAPQTEANLLQL